MADALRSEKLKQYISLDELEETKGLAAMETAYTEARDKVCEIMAARALARPATPDVRKSLAEKAKETVKTLEGSLSPALSMALNTAAGGQ